VTHMRDVAAASGGQPPRGGGRHQMVHTAAHGTLPQAALEDALFRMLTPAPSCGNPPPPCPSATPPAAVASAVQSSGGMGLPPDPLAVKLPLQAGAVAYPPPNSAPYGLSYGSNASPTCVTTDLLLPPWVDAKCPPTWYDDGGDIDALLEDAGCLDWLADTGDLQEDYPHAAVSNGSSRAGDAGMRSEPSSESLSFLVEPTPVHGPAAGIAREPTAVRKVASAPVEDVHALPSFLEESKSPPSFPVVPYVIEAGDTHERSGDDVRLPLSTDADDRLPSAGGTDGDDDVVGPSHASLMGFPELDMGDEQAFVSALLENSGGGVGGAGMSFPKLSSAEDGLDRHHL